MSPAEMGVFRAHARSLSIKAYKRDLQCQAKNSRNRIHLATSDNLMADQGLSIPPGDTPDPEMLGAKIRRLRTERGVGQERLAIEANVDQSGLSKFERGKDNRALSEGAIRRLAVALKTSFENLIEGTDYRPT